QRLRSNAERWLRMPPEEQRVLRDREMMRRQRIQREADAALQQSGLQLEAEKREAYERRYLHERRGVEQTLRQDMEARRQRWLAEGSAAISAIPRIVRIKYRLPVLRFDEAEFPSR